MKLYDLNKLRTSPEINHSDRVSMMKELVNSMEHCDWFTIGIMAQSYDDAINALRKLEKRQHWPTHQLLARPEQEGPVFLKANQVSRQAHVRIEYGLGEGILISGHSSDESQMTTTWGPLPLDFF